MMTLLCALNYLENETPVMRSESSLSLAGGEGTPLLYASNTIGSRRMGHAGQVTQDRSRRTVAFYIKMRESCLDV